MKGWNSARLGDTIKTNQRSVVRGYPHEKILYLDTGSITCGKIEALQELEIKVAPSRAKRIVQDDDIIYSAVRPIQRHYGFITNPPDNLVVSTGFVVITCDQKKIFPKYLYHYLTANSQVEELDMIAEASTSTYPSLKPEDIENLDIFFPKDIDEQKAIASVLSSLDDKIDLLHRQNKTLESMVETLFRQWFMEEAQEERKDGTIADLVDFNPSRILRKGSIAPYLEMAALSTTTFNPDKWYDREFSSGTKFINGDTLLARITPCLENGKTAFITFLEKDQVAWGSTEYIVMRSKVGLHPFFAYVLARNIDFRDYAEGCMEGSSGRQRVNVDHLKDYDIKVPPESVMREFNSFAESIVPKLHSNFLQIRTLEKLRDTLLPKLMSGEIRVAT